MTSTDDETICPLNLVELAEQRGVFSDLLAGLRGVTLEQLRDKAREFVSYWTIGAGMGKRRRQWMARLREDLRRAHRENRLRPPGAVEHDPITDPGAGWKMPEEQRRRIAAFKEQQEVRHAGNGKA